MTEDGPITRLAYWLAGELVAHPFLALLGMLLVAVAAWFIGARIWKK